MIVASVFFVIACTAAYYFILSLRERLSFIQAAELLPGPKTHPIIGNAYEFLKWPLEQFLQNITKLADSYVSPFRFWLGSHLIIYVYDPDQAKVLFRSTTCLNKNILYRSLKPWLRNGLITVNTPTWYKHRKIVASCFNTNVLREVFKTFAEQSIKFMEQFATNEKNELDLLDHITKTNMDILYATTLGVKLDSEKNQNYLYVHALKRLKEIFLRRTLNIFLASDFVFNFTSMKHEQQQHLDFIHSVGRKVINKKKSKMNTSTVAENEDGRMKRKVLLDTLIQASSENKEYTQDCILDEISTIFMAGSDTTATTLYFTIYMLANFPEVQEKAYEELLDIYGKTDTLNASINYDDLKCMHYMDRVIQESMRLFPVVPFIGRHTIEDLELENCTVPKNSNVIIMIMHIHRNEKYWPNPLKFDPDRFLPENSVGRHPYCYIPFSEGPRNCIGKRYAMLSMKVFLATLLRTYELKVDKRKNIEDIQVKSDMLLSAAEPLKVKFTRRNVNN